MTQIRLYTPTDEAAVINLWHICNLLRPWNNPRQDIARKLHEDASLFFVAAQDARAVGSRTVNSCIVGSCMAGYDGHRGWIYYLAVHPEYQKQGIAKRLMDHAEEALQRQGCPKVELMVRSTNVQVVDFYEAIGYTQEPVTVLSKRLTDDEEYDIPA